jgi:uncharacterized protein YjbI with pentapeptide repeats
MEHETSKTQQQKHHTMGRTRSRQSEIGEVVMTQPPNDKRPKHQVRKWYATACNWLKKQQLFMFIAIWAVFAMAIVFGLCRWFLGSWLWKLNPHITSVLDVVRISLTIVGGIGAVGYLVIKYQERQASQREEQRTKDQLDRRRFNEAISLFGSENAITRMAGVHALIEVGNRYSSLRQEIVNLLCGYLRSKRIDDNACESILLDLLHAVLSGASGVRWRDDLFLDLHGAECAERLYLSDCTLRGINLNNAIFNNDFVLNNVTMNKAFSCRHTQFMETLSLQGCTFQSGADFSYTHVVKATVIQHTTFNSPNMENEREMRTSDGSLFKTHKEYPVDAVGAEFLGWFLMKTVVFNTDCLLMYPANHSFYDGRQRRPSRFGTVPQSEPEKPFAWISNFSIQQVTFNETLLVDELDPIYLSDETSKVTISRKDVKDYLDNYIEKGLQESGSRTP